MGRVKIPMELINDPKKRKITFQRRKDGLIKKARELSTLCDVNVSMIICSDLQEGPEIFPRDHVKLNDVINAYKRQRVSDPGKIKAYTLRDFFNDRENKTEAELAKAKQGYELEKKLDQVMPLLNHNPIITMANFDYNNNDNTSIISNSHMESSGSSVTYADNGFYPIMPMGQNDFGTDERLMQAFNPNSMSYDRPNFDLKRPMMHQLEQPQNMSMQQFMLSCFY